MRVSVRGAWSPDVIVSRMTPFWTTPSKRALRPPSPIWSPGCGPGRASVMKPLAVKRPLASGVTVPKRASLQSSRSVAPSGRRGSARRDRPPTRHRVARQGRGRSAWSARAGQGHGGQLGQVPDRPEPGSRQAAVARRRRRKPGPRGPAPSCSRCQAPEPCRGRRSSSPGRRRTCPSATHRCHSDQPFAGVFASRANSPTTQNMSLSTGSSVTWL